MDININNLLDSLNKLKRSSSYSGIKIGEENNFIAIDNSGCVSLVISTSETQSMTLNTDHLRLFIGLDCSVTIDTETITGKFHVLNCKTLDKKLIQMFLVLCLSLINSLTSRNNSQEIKDFFNGLVQLFKISPDVNLQKERQGLWGELFLIKQMGNVKEVMKYWQSEPTRKFDFSRENNRIEVKTTTKPLRVHSFSHNQLFRQDDLKIFIASLKLQEEDAGLSLKDLINFVREEISQDVSLLLKLEKAVLKCNMQSDDGPRYDNFLALTHCKLFNASFVPKFNLPEPDGVSNTKYSVNLENSLELSPEQKDLLFNFYINN